MIYSCNDFIIFELFGGSMTKRMNGMTILTILGISTLVFAATTSIRFDRDAFYEGVQLHSFETDPVAAAQVKALYDALGCYPTLDQLNAVGLRGLYHSRHNMSSVRIDANSVIEIDVPVCEGPGKNPLIFFQALYKGTSLTGEIVSPNGNVYPMALTEVRTGYGDHMLQSNFSAAIGGPDCIASSCLSPTVRVTAGLWKVRLKSSRRVSVGLIALNIVNADELGQEAALGTVLAK